MRLKTLNGAPLCEHLDFSSQTLLRPDEVVSIFAFHGPAATQYSTEQEESLTTLKWRYLASKNKRLRTGWSQPYLPARGMWEDDVKLSFSIPMISQSPVSNEQGSNFIEKTKIINESEIELDDFLEHSFIFHDTLLSSQLACGDGDKAISSSSFLTSFETATSEISSSPGVEGQHTITQIPSAIQVTSLASLPNVTQLRSLTPQTPTPNLLCVLTSPPACQDVMVKKGSYRMHLYEIAVADDTKAGFKISFWFRPGKDTEGVRADLLRTLNRLKVGDILLLRNVALNDFRGDVYGQSLNASITRARTTVEILLTAGGLSASNLGELPAAVVQAFARVKKWANSHVAPGHQVSRTRKGSERRTRSSKRSLTEYELGDASLPPDTMET